MVSEVFKEPLKFTLHRVHLFAHVEDDLDTGKIDTEIARQGQNYFKAFEVGVGVKTGVANRPRRLEQALPFIEPECLRMDIVKLRNGADGVGFDSFLRRRHRIAF